MIITSSRAIIVVTAIVCVTAIEIVNLLTRNVDGTIMGMVIAAIAGLAGYRIGKR